jgi:hypothetical protein
MVVEAGGIVIGTGEDEPFAVDLSGCPGGEPAEPEGECGALADGSEPRATALWSWCPTGRGRRSLAWTVLPWLPLSSLRSRRGPGTLLTESGSPAWKELEGRP